MIRVYLDKLTQPIECDNGRILVESKNLNRKDDAEDRVWLVKSEDPLHKLCLHISYRKQNQPAIRVTRIVEA